MNLGTFYAKGLGAPQNDVRAVHWFKLAAEQGETVAQERLAEMYAEGRGVELDEQEARRWRRAAEESRPQRDPPASLIEVPGVSGK